MMATTETLLLNKLVAFQKAAQDLLQTWDEQDHTGEALTNDYPFASSFDDVVHSINQWVETQSNIGKQ